MCVPERHSDDHTAKADHLDKFLIRRSLSDGQDVTVLEPELGHQLKNCGASSCCARQVIFSWMCSSLRFPWPGVCADVCLQDLSNLLLWPACERHLMPDRDMVTPSCGKDMHRILRRMCLLLCKLRLMIVVSAPKTVVFCEL